MNPHVRLLSVGCSVGLSVIGLSVCHKKAGKLQFHAPFGALFINLRLTLLFEGEVLCEVPALVVAPEEEEGGGVAQLQRPQIQHTLK